jgi:hypothetical protein
VYQLGLLVLTLFLSYKQKTKVVIKFIEKSKIIIDSWIRDRKLGLIPLEIHILRKLAEYPHINCCSLGKDKPK